MTSRDHVVSVRLTDTELAWIDALRRGRSRSDTLRALAVDEAAEASRVDANLTIIIHRDNGLWWAEIGGHSEYTAGDATFDGLCERLAEGLHLLGLNRERTAITLKDTALTAGMYPNHEYATSANPRVFVFHERAS